MATKIRQSNLDNSIVTGLDTLNAGAATTDQVIVYDASAGALKKISQTNLLNFPNITSVTPTNVLSGDGTGNHTFIINGSGYTGASANLVNNSGVAVAFSSITVNSDIKITGVIAKSSLPGSGEPYDVKVTAATGLTSTLANQINIDQSPVYVTAAGSLGGIMESTSSTFTVVASDPESAGNVSFEIQSGSIPAGMSSSTVHENGVSKFKITGTASAVSGDTTNNFVLRAVDAASNTTSRAFSITVINGGVQTFTSTGTFTVPSGLSDVDVLLIAGGGGGGGANAPTGRGGGGGAGGLIYFPNYPVTAGTLTVTVGCGGGGGTGQNEGTDGQDSVFGLPSDPGISPAGGLTAKGGGGGGHGAASQSQGAGRPGGSGGSSGYAQNPAQAGTAVQPTQPGNSGAYGFGFPGADQGSSEGSGGGGAGGKGFTNNNNPTPTGPGTGGGGGIGKTYTISGGSVNYAGGGGGGGVNFSDQSAQTGVGYGGGRGAYSPGSGVNGCAGTANRGGGGGGAGSDTGTRTGGAGGKGIVIVNV